jgi:hypothetical protein
MLYHHKFAGRSKKHQYMESLFTLTSSCYRAHPNINAGSRVRVRLALGAAFDHVGVQTREKSHVLAFGAGSKKGSSWNFNPVIL